MTGIGNSIVSSSLPKEEPVLRAVFSQITAEVRKKGIILGEEEGSFYVSDKFGWKTTVREFFDAYHRICERKQVHPLYQEAKLTSALKVPYAGIDTVNLFHDGVAKRLLQFRTLRIPPFDKLSASPSDAELRRMMDASDDEDVRRFLGQVLLVDEELRRYVARLDDLAAAYQLRLTAFAEAFAGTEKEDVVRRKYQESRRRIDAVLDPYVSRLKKAEALPSSWRYSYARLPLTEEGRRYLGIMTMASDLTGYWEKDELPLKSVREAAERKRREEERAAAERKRREEERAAAERKRREEERAAAERKRREEERVAAERKRREEERAAAEREAARKRVARAEPAGSPARPAGGVAVGKRPRGVELSRPSLWMRFDKGVAKIGRWFYYKMDDISDWAMYAWYVLAALFALSILISAWVNSGFLLALVLFLIGVALFEFLAGIAVLVGAGIKILFKLPLRVLRYIFYNGIALLVVLGATGLLILYQTVMP